MTTSSTSNDYSFSTTNNKLSTASTINYTVSDQTVTTATVALTENLSKFYFKKLYVLFFS